MTGVKKQRIIFLAAALAAVLLADACRSKDSKDKKNPGNADRQLPVKVEPVKKGDVRRIISFVGELKASESVEISSKIPGRIEKIFVHMGDRVNEGDVLVRIDDSELKAQLDEAKASIAVFQASVTKAEAEYKNSQSQLERKEKLAEKKLITPQELDNALTASATAASSVEVSKSQLSQARARTKLLKSQFADAKIKASFSGFVDARYLDPGSVVSPGTPIMKLVKKQPIIARFQVEERYIGEIRNMMSGAEVTVEVEVDAYQNEIFAGRIIRFSPGLQSESRTAIVEAEIPNEDGRLMPSMYCRVKVDFGVKEDVLTVPLRAIIEDIKIGEEKEDSASGKVYVVENGKAKLVDITVGWKQEDEGEVMSGIKQGDVVVVEGQASLKKGAAVKIIK